MTALAARARFRFVGKALAAAETRLAAINEALAGSGNDAPRVALAFQFVPEPVGRDEALRVLASWRPKVAGHAVSLRRELSDARARLHRAEAQEGVPS